MTAEGRERTRRWIARLDRDRATLLDELEPEIASVRNLRLTEKGRQIASTCASAWAIIRSRDDFPALLDQREEPAPDYPEKWRAMNSRFGESQTRSGTE